MDKKEAAGLKNWFDGYADGYPAADPAGREAYELKRQHSLRVSDNCIAIGRDQGWDEAQIAVAGAIGLLHDVGRFEQYRRYRTFRDGKSEDHAELGALVLRASGALSPLTDAEQRLILAAVSCHNRLIVPADAPSRERMFCQIIRDADKIDIMRVVTDYYASGVKSAVIELDLPDEPAYAEEIIDDLFAGRLVEMKKMKTLNDFKLLQLGWVHDLNFPLAARRIRQERYLEKIRKGLPESEAIDELLLHLNNHLDMLGNS